MERKEQEEADAAEIEGKEQKKKKKGIFGKIYRMIGRNGKSDKKKIKTAEIEKQRSQSDVEYLEK